MPALPFTLEPMPLLGVTVKNFEEEVRRYSKMFDIEFRIFRPGVDYHLAYDSTGAPDTSAPLPSGLRIAVDTNDLFELVDMPEAEEGVRNIHYRVDDLDRAVEHFVEHGLTLLHVVQAGNAREAIFDATSLNGVRMCLMEFEGDSFSEALAASPRPSRD